VSTKLRIWTHPYGPRDSSLTNIRVQKYPRYSDPLTVRTDTKSTGPAMPAAVASPTRRPLADAGTGLGFTR
jgi:hypothetical protein